ncbi:protease inhibitor I9 family protein [Bacillus sp. B-jedd]|uniref:protease inhibitor I9 family protein n=1 Tax=Bacillus sp. B-jedd TaxID=1476857 RepID=UPI0005155F5C|nr:protease inhibitor I9 family protein [Bacillus sp. B-jedd]CEG29422.1 peptidase Vpr [Bacillus sp. B-jedd]
MSTIYIDPAINMKTDQMITIIIHFKTQPAHAAVAIAKSCGNPLSLEEAKQEVEASHLRFQNDIQKLLGDVGVAFKINHTYKTVFNGVSLSLPGNVITELIKSSEIAAIYANKEYKLDLPFVQF